MSRPHVYAWDASVLLAWLGEEEGAPLGGIDSVVEEIDAGDRVATLIVSVVAHTEVLAAKHTEDQIKKFRAFLERSNVLVVDVDLRVSEKAEAIRSKALAEGRKIKTPDAQHLATAILYRADVFHTLDDKLINLSGSAIVDGLTISKPISHTGQGMLG
jgi:predicted nucleic acid-binding protein